MTLTTHAPAVLVIGGSDSSGGAGIARDLRTLNDMGVFGVAVITAVTAQTHSSVRSSHLVPAALIEDQIATALAANTIRAIKIGMLGARQVVEAVVRSLPPRVEVPVVLDPVLAASSGRELLDEGGRQALIDELLPRVTLMTPNIPEAATLLGETGTRDNAHLANFAVRLLGYGPRAVLVKGGHAEGDECVDLLVTGPNDIFALRGPRLPGALRGTGCALASAIAAGLARDRALLAACQDAKRYIASLFEQAIAE